jgi:hypothetical protein
MTKKQKQQLLRLENAIIKLVHYVGDSSWGPGVRDLDKKSREQLGDLLGDRCRLLNEMFRATPEEVEDFRKVNERLFDLTQKMHAKTLSLYKAILKTGYDHEFDDDIMVDGTLRFVYNDEDGSLYWSEEDLKDSYNRPNAYGSNFPAMMDILYEYYEESATSECAFCSVSYSIMHNRGMSAKELGIDNFLDDGQSWAEGWLRRDEFKDICICHAVHDLCTHKYFSIPDLLRMNDFWCEVKITHQLLSDRDGKRYSFIEPRKED